MTGKSFLLLSKSRSNRAIFSSICSISGKCFRASLSLRSNSARESSILLSNRHLSFATCLQNNHQILSDILCYIAASHVCFKLIWLRTVEYNKCACAVSALKTTPDSEKRGIVICVEQPQVDVGAVCHVDNLDCKMVRLLLKVKCAQHWISCIGLPPD